MDDALRDRLVERPGGLLQAFTSDGRVARADGGAHVAYDARQARLDRLVALTALLALSMSLQCRGMPSHGGC